MCFRSNRCPWNKGFLWSRKLEKLWAACVKWGSGFGPLYAKSASRRGLLCTGLPKETGLMNSFSRKHPSPSPRPNSLGSRFREQWSELGWPLEVYSKPIISSLDTLRPEERRALPGRAILGSGLAGIPSAWASCFLPSSPCAPSSQVPGGECIFFLTESSGRGLGR